MGSNSDSAFDGRREHMDIVFKIGIVVLIALFIIITFALMKAASDEDDRMGRDDN